ncbi:M23 family metallopeptidase [Microaerobacter geothermalis]|uniref:M23 family metallopeptidase n=1 Tax=Microaerobacter geothermalis TaxID=674972 RepID=UPI001F3585F5|nr:M23 family metallopeptidase [Microaerobacter geothermalis]MCF6093247.1 M23 family metallopeptidase [Microaerobacter geothermalis]
MSEQQKNRESTRPAVKPSKWRRFLRNKWTFPVIYLAAAGLILAFILWYQDPNDLAIDKNELGLEGIEYSENAPGTTEDSTTFETADTEESVAVTGTKEQMIWPVDPDADVDITMNYFDQGASEEVQASALVKYEDTYWPHTGVDIAALDGKPFNVVAALSGEVIQVEQSPTVGNLVEIDHGDGLVTVYQSLDEVKVKEKDQVTQGDPIGVAGRNIFEKDAGVHLHFEVRKDGNAVSPDSYLGGPDTQEQVAQ